MANNRIKGLVVEIGGDTTKLGKALEQTEKQTRGLTSELADVNKLLKLDPGNTDLLAQKQRILGELIGKTGDKLTALRAANEKAAKSAENYDKWLRKYQPLQEESDKLREQLRKLQQQQRKIAEEEGPDSDGYRALQPEVDAVRAALKSLQQQQKAVTDEFGDPASPEQLRALQREITKTEKQLADYADAQADAAQSASDLKTDLQQTATEVKSEGKAASDSADAHEDLGDAAHKAVDGLKVLVTAAAGAVAGIVALAETTREYRTELAKLDTAFETAGHSAEAGRETYKALQGVLGETDQAVEAANHLAQLVTTEEDLATWTDTLTGVYGTFGASLPIEGLTEAANETARVGQVTGPLADALNWAAKEGETFGVTLRDNIEFTELSAKELAGLTESELAEYEAKKAQYEATEAYNQSVQDAQSAEDLFNIALANCSDEQERQALITKTLNGLYSAAADKYRDTNREVIRANEAQENLNAALADVGAAVEPAVTDIKELGAELLKSAEKPIERVAKYVQNKFIPALREFSNWALDNIPTVAGVVAGLTVAVLAYKAATVLSKTITEADTVATWLNVAAHTALNAVLKASPLGLVAAAAGALVGGITAIAVACKKAKEPVSLLSEEEQRLSDEAREAAEAFREQQQATQDSIVEAQAEMGHVQALADELRGLADANGVVSTANRGRAEYILTQLNDALGTEFEMNGLLIAQYDELAKSVDAAIEKRKAELLLEAYERDYVAALKGKSRALEEVTRWQTEYAEQGETIAQDRAYLIQLEQDYNDALAISDTMRAQGVQNEIQATNDRIDEAERLREETKAQLDAAAADYDNYLTTIDRYEDASLLAAQGYAAEAIDLLDKKTGAYRDYGDSVDKATQQVLNSLESEAVEAGRKARKTRANFEAGIKGYTRDMVIEAERGYEEATKAFATARQDATGIAAKWSDGMATGIDGTRYMVLDEIDTTVQALADSAEDSYVAGREVGEYYGDGLAAGLQSRLDRIRQMAGETGRALDGAVRRELAVYSPSRKAIEIGQYYGKGLEIGVDKSTEGVERAGKRQAEKLLAAQSALSAPVPPLLRGARPDASQANAVRPNVSFGDMHFHIDNAGKDYDVPALARAMSAELERMVGRRMMYSGI